jgi:hypothetical protein
VNWPWKNVPSANPNNCALPTKASSPREAKLSRNMIGIIDPKMT